MQVEEKVEKLKKETIALRKEMVIMKTLVKQQNEIIKSLLEKAHGGELYVESFTKAKNYFPIRTQEQLDSFEHDINYMNRNEIIYEAQLCIRREGLAQSLNKILDVNLIMNYNLEGTYNKKRLLDYQNLLDVLFQATLTDNWDHTKFIAELRLGVRKIKKRQLKVISRQNISGAQNIKVNEIKNDDSEDDENENENDNDDEVEGEGDDGEDDDEDYVP